MSQLKRKRLNLRNDDIFDEDGNPKKIKFQVTKLAQIIPKQMTFTIPPLTFSQDTKIYIKNTIFDVTLTLKYYAQIVGSPAIRNDFFALKGAEAYKWLRVRRTFGDNLINYMKAELGNQNVISTSGSPVDISDFFNFPVAHQLSMYNGFPINDIVTHHIDGNANYVVGMWQFPYWFRLDPTKGVFGTASRMFADNGHLRTTMERWMGNYLHFCNFLKNTLNNFMTAMENSVHSNYRDAFRETLEKTHWLRMPKELQYDYYHGYFANIKKGIKGYSEAGHQLAYEFNKNIQQNPITLYGMFSEMASEDVVPSSMTTLFNWWDWPGKNYPESIYRSQMLKLSIPSNFVPRLLGRKTDEKRLGPYKITDVRKIPNYNEYKSQVQSDGSVNVISTDVDNSLLTTYLPTGKNSYNEYGPQFFYFTGFREILEAETPTTTYIEDYTEYATINKFNVNHMPSPWRLYSLHLSKTFASFDPSTAPAVGAPQEFAAGRPTLHDTESFFISAVVNGDNLLTREVNSLDFDVTTTTALTSDQMTDRPPYLTYDTSIPFSLSETPQTNFIPSYAQEEWFSSYNHYLNWIADFPRRIPLNTPKHCGSWVFDEKAHRFYYAINVDEDYIKEVHAIHFDEIASDNPTEVNTLFGQFVPLSDNTQNNLLGSLGSNRPNVNLGFEMIKSDDLDTIKDYYITIQANNQYLGIPSQFGNSKNPLNTIYKATQSGKPGSLINCLDMEKQIYNFDTPIDFNEMEIDIKDSNQDSYGPRFVNDKRLNLSMQLEFRSGQETLKNAKFF